MKYMIEYDVNEIRNVSEVNVVFPDEGEYFYNYYLCIMQCRYDLSNIERRGRCLSFRTDDPMFYLKFFTDRPNLFDLKNTKVDKCEYSDGGATCEIWQDVNEYQ